MIYDKIKEKHLTARKEHATIAVNLYSTILGQVDYSRDTSDSNVIGIITKIRKGVATIKEFEEKRGGNSTVQKLELSLIDGFLPKQLSKDEILTIISRLPDSPNFIKVAMTHFKENYSGQYNSKQLLDVIKEKGT